MATVGKLICTVSSKTDTLCVNGINETYLKGTDFSIPPSGDCW